LKEEKIFKNVKMGWGHLKIFSRTTWPMLTRFGTNHRWGEGIHVYSNKAQGPFQRGDNHKNVIRWSGAV
jgi:hypothetical protein